MSNHETSTPNPEQPKNIVFDVLSNADIRAFQPGDIVSGLNSRRDIDAFEAQVAMAVFDRPVWWWNIRPDNGPASSSLSQELTKPSSSKVKKASVRKFIGELTNGSATVVSANLEGDARSLSLAMQTDMYSSGRGKIGSFTRGVTYTRRNGSHDIAHRRIHDFANREQAEGFIRSLDWESTTVASMVARLGLSHEISGGLPTISKRAR